MFAPSLKLRGFSADLLESAMLDPDDHRVFLGELLYKLLRPDASQGFAEGDAAGWEHLLRRKLASQWSEAFEEHPLTQNDFFGTAPMTRVRLLYALCEWRAVECPVVRDAIRRVVDGPDEPAGSLRHFPVGEDSRGGRYFYFSGNNEDCRLYREEPPRKKSGKRTDGPHEQATWETVCTTLEDIEGLADKFTASKHKAERSLHTVLADGILPRLVETANARKRAQEKAAALEALPKKRSSRLQLIQDKRDEEDKVRKEEALRLEEQRKEWELHRSEREREQRALKKQREDETRIKTEAEYRRKLMGFNPDGPSREERMQRRVQADTTASSDTHPSPDRVSATPPLPMETGITTRQRAMPPEKRREARERERERYRDDSPPPPRSRASEEPSQPLPRLRPAPARNPRYAGRKREHTAGWSPVGATVPKRRRIRQAVPRPSMSVLTAAVKGLGPMIPGMSDARLAAMHGQGLGGALGAYGMGGQAALGGARSSGLYGRGGHEDMSRLGYGQQRQQQQPHGAGLGGGSMAGPGGYGQMGHEESQLQMIQKRHHMQRQQLLAQLRTEGYSHEHMERLHAALVQKQQQQMQGFMEQLRGSAGGLPSQSLTPAQQQQISMLPTQQQAQFIQRLRQHQLALQQQQAAADAQQKQALTQQAAQQAMLQQLVQQRQQQQQQQQRQQALLQQQQQHQQQQRLAGAGSAHAGSPSLGLPGVSQGDLSSWDQQRQGGARSSSAGPGRGVGSPAFMAPGSTGDMGPSGASAGMQGWAQQQQQQQAQQQAHQQAQQQALQQQRHSGHMGLSPRMPPSGQAETSRPGSAAAGLPQMPTSGRSPGMPGSPRDPFAGQQGQALAPGMAPQGSQMMQAAASAAAPITTGQPGQAPVVNPLGMPAVRPGTAQVTTGTRTQPWPAMQHGSHEGVSCTAAAFLFRHAGAHQRSARGPRQSAAAPQGAQPHSP
ncbi:hypothetical protein WJX73_008682 [Symbiochloris irregularis]|uniref:Uncharacterized protein n=1 Tax=Symbiochloris irregularis TaxID=706552 RepID=A0AAW1Q2R0_9CHLO